LGASAIAGYRLTRPTKISFLAQLPALKGFMNGGNSRQPPHRRNESLRHQFLHSQSPSCMLEFFPGQPPSGWLFYETGTEKYL